MKHLAQKGNYQDLADIFKSYGVTTLNNSRVLCGVAIGLFWQDSARF